MRPDFANLMPMIAAEGGRSLLVVRAMTQTQHASGDADAAWQTYDRRRP
jgi:hypothetical protein